MSEPFKGTINVDIRDSVPDCGHALYIKDGRLHHAYNFADSFEQKIVAAEDVPSGTNLILSASFDKDGEDPPAYPPGSCPSTTGTTRPAKPGSRPSPASS